MWSFHNKKWKPCAVVLVAAWRLAWCCFIHLLDLKAGPSVFCAATNPYRLSCIYALYSPVAVLANLNWRSNSLLSLSSLHNMLDNILKIYLRYPLLRSRKVIWFLMLVRPYDTIGCIFIRKLTLGWYWKKMNAFQCIYCSRCPSPLKVPKVSRKPEWSAESDANIFIFVNNIEW